MHMPCHARPCHCKCDCDCISSAGPPFCPKAHASAKCSRQLATETVAAQQPRTQWTMGRGVPALNPCFLHQKSACPTTSRWFAHWRFRFSSNPSIKLYYEQFSDQPTRHSQAQCYLRYKEIHEVQSKETSSFRQGDSSGSAARH